MHRKADPVTRALEVAGLADGYRMTLSADADVLTKITATINAERHCCPFLQFDLRVPAGGSDVVLNLTGPDGTRVFLDALLAA